MLRKSLCWVLLGYLILLGVRAVGNNEPQGLLGATIWELQNSAQLVQWIGELAVRGLMEVSRFALLGLLVVLVIGRRGSRKKEVDRSEARKMGKSLGSTEPTGEFIVSRRPGSAGASPSQGASHDQGGSPSWVELPWAGWVRGSVWFAFGLLVVFGVSWLVRWFELGRVPIAVYLILPWIGGLLGVCCGWLWLAGRRGRWGLVTLLLLLPGFTLATVGTLALLAVEDEPLTFQPAKINSAEKRRLVQLVSSGRSPYQDTVQWKFSERDLDLLLAWGLTLGSANRKAEVQLDEGRGVASASLGVPLGGGRTRYLNVQAAGQLDIEKGQMQLDVKRLRIGRIQVPSRLLSLGSLLLISAVYDDPDLRELVTSIESLRIEPQSMYVTGIKSAEETRAMRSLLARMGAKPEATAKPEVLEATRAHAVYLVEFVEARGGDVSLEDCLRGTFAFARRRSETNDPVLENRAAIFSLAILLGHWRVEKMVGPVTDIELRQRARRYLRNVPVRGRPDWTRHFSVSAGLALLSSEPASDAVGLLKEELDAGRSSGFSFGDLLANRAGTLFALAATHDEQAARRIQTRLAGDWQIDELFPPGDDLPRGVSDAALQENYGGVGGAGFQQVVEEIERRLGQCDLLWPDSGGP